MRKIFLFLNDEAMNHEFLHTIFQILLVNLFILSFINIQYYIVFLLKISNKRQNVTMIINNY